MFTVFNRFLLAVCLMIVAATVYGLNSATDGLLAKSFNALIVAYNVR